MTKFWMLECKQKNHERVSKNFCRRDLEHVLYSFSVAPFSILQPGTKVCWLPSWTMKVRGIPQGRRSRKLEGAMEQNCRSPDYLPLEFSVGNCGRTNAPCLLRDLSSSLDIPQ